MDAASTDAELGGEQAVEPDDTSRIDDEGDVQGGAPRGHRFPVHEHLAGFHGDALAGQARYVAGDLACQGLVVAFIPDELAPQLGHRAAFLHRAVPGEIAALAPVDQPDVEPPAGRIDTEETAGGEPRLPTATSAPAQGSRQISSTDVPANRDNDLTDGTD